MSGDSLLASKVFPRTDPDLGETRHQSRLGRVCRAVPQYEVQNVEELPVMFFSVAGISGWNEINPRRRVGPASPRKAESAPCAL